MCLDVSTGMRQHFADVRIAYKVLCESRWTGAPDLYGPFYQLHGNQSWRRNTTVFMDPGFDGFYGIHVFKSELQARSYARKLAVMSDLYIATLFVLPSELLYAGRDVDSHILAATYRSVTLLDVQPYTGERL